jgi:hypothetical protein
MCVHSRGWVAERSGYLFGMFDDGVMMNVAFDIALELRRSNFFFVRYSMKYNARTSL